MKIDDFRRGLVRVCDAEGSTRGTGFFVSESGHVLTCDHVVRSVQELSVTLADGRNIPATLAPDLSLPELDLATLKTDAQPDFVVPVEFAGGIGDSVWTSGFQMKDSVSDALPTLGKIAGQTGLNYNSGEQTYHLPEILRLEDAMVRPGLSGAMAVLEKDLVAIGLINAELNDKGGFILPFRATKGQPLGLHDLLQENRRRVPRYGRFTNWLGLARLCINRSNGVLSTLEQSGRYDRGVYINRALAEETFQRFLQSNSSVLCMVGQTGTGKTSLAAHLTELSPQRQDRPALLLLAYRLIPEAEGIASSVAKELNKGSPGLPPLSAGDLIRTTSNEEAHADLVVVLDGLNELPGTIDGAREWLESTWEWLRKAPRVKLVITCRPEYWDSVKEFVDSDLLFADLLSSLPGSKDQRGVLTLGDFSSEEAQQARTAYGLDVGQQSDVLRHPLLFGIASKALRSHGEALPSIPELFADYIESAVNRIRSARPQPPSSISIRSKLEQLASVIRQNQSLWLDKEQFFETFSSDASLADAFLGEHLLIEGQSGIRFAFDEIAYYLVFRSSAKEFVPKITAGVVDWMQFEEADRIGSFAIPFMLAQLEEQGKSEVVSEILMSLAIQIHAGEIDQAFNLHLLFRKFVQWLRFPSTYLRAVETSVLRCTQVRHCHGKFFLTSVIDLTGLQLEQKLHLLRIIARHENDDDYRWKDWDRSSDESFWRDEWPRPRENPSFRKTMRDVLSEYGEPAITALLEWVGDETGLMTSLSSPEATIGDLACGILFHSTAEWFELICNGLAKMASSELFDKPTLLLRLIAKRNPEEMIDVYERWAGSGELGQTFVTDHVTYLFSLRPRNPDLRNRLLAILETLLTHAESQQIQAQIVSGLSADPDTALRALNLAETLVANGAVIDTSLWQRLIPVDPDRVLAQLTLIIEHDPDLDRRKWAAYALRDMAEVPDRIIKLLPLVEGYLFRYPELTGRFGLVIGYFLHASEPGSKVERYLLEWITKSFARIDPDCRQQIIYFVIDRSEKSPAAMALLDTVIDVETPDGNLSLLLELLPKAKLPKEKSFLLTQRVAEKHDAGQPVQLSLLDAVMLSGDREFGQYFASQVATTPQKWSKSIVEFSDLVHEGKDPFDAANEVINKILEELERKRG